ncbi:MAG: YdeI/OmpD-associated family protein [Blastocatellia bacterium]
MIKFAQRIYKIGINPVVDPPDDVLAAIFEQAGKSKGPIPVCGKLNGAEFIQTLVKYRGAWRLYINAEMLKASGLKVGDTANVEIEFDPRPREVPIPPEFAIVLKKDKAAKAEFDKLSPGRRKEILQYLGFLKTEESLTRNIDRVLRHLRGEKAETLYALMRKPKS